MFGGRGAEPDGLDPTRSAFDVSGHPMASAVFDPLVEVDDEGVAVPYPAESIEPNEDFTQWVITLPEGVTFHDGTPPTRRPWLNFRFLAGRSSRRRRWPPWESHEATGPPGGHRHHVPAVCFSRTAWPARPAAAPAS